MLWDMKHFQTQKESCFSDTWSLLYTIAILALLQLQQSLICKKNPCTVKRTKKRWQVIIEILWLSYCRKTHRLALPSLRPQNSIELPVVYTWEEALMCKNDCLAPESVLFVGKQAMGTPGNSLCHTVCTIQLYISTCVHICIILSQQTLIISNWFQTLDWHRSCVTAHQWLYSWERKASIARRRAYVLPKLWSGLIVVTECKDLRALPSWCVANSREGAQGQEGAEQIWLY